MIRQYICTHSSGAEFQEDMFTFFNASFLYPKWIDDTDHTLGFNLYYDSECADLCAECMRTGIGDSTNIFTFINFPIDNGTNVSVRENAGASQPTIQRCLMIETDCGIAVMMYKSSGTAPTTRSPRFFFITKNRGFARRQSRASTTLDNQWTTFTFKGDQNPTTLSYAAIDTVYTCFAPVCGDGITYSNNQLLFTPFSSTPNYPCIVDSDIGKFVTDGFFAIPEYLEEVT